MHQRKCVLVKLFNVLRTKQFVDRENYPELGQDDKQTNQLIVNRIYDNNSRFNLGSKDDSPMTWGKNKVVMSSMLQQNVNNFKHKITNEIQSYRYIILVLKRHSASCVVIVGFFSSLFSGDFSFFFIYIADLNLDDTLENQYQDVYTLFIQYS